MLAPTPRLRLNWVLDVDLTPVCLFSVSCQAQSPSALRYDASSARKTRRSVFGRLDARPPEDRVMLKCIEIETYTETVSTSQPRRSPPIWWGLQARREVLRKLSIGDPLVQYVFIRVAQSLRLIFTDTMDCSHRSFTFAVATLASGAAALRPRRRCAVYQSPAPDTTTCKMAEEDAPYNRYLANSE